MASSTTIASSGSSAPITAGGVLQVERAAVRQPDAFERSDLGRGAPEYGQRLERGHRVLLGARQHRDPRVGIGEPARQARIGEEPDRRLRSHDHEVVEAAQRLERRAR